MFSCDTMAVNALCSRYGVNLFAKNSDRPSGEPQPLCFYEGGEYPDGALLRTTHITIPQAKRTYSVVGSRPYWIWGFEMGYNEKGLVIGNEAEGSRMPAETEIGLLGMDMLRIALERSASAGEAISVITQLLEKYGQRAKASALTERTYENSFIIVDKNECWVLETAGREWVAKRIETAKGISNCYSIGGDYDIGSENVERTARENRWLAPNEKFDFAKAYSGRLVSQPFGVQRYRRLNKLLAQRNVHCFESLRGILRDHFDGEIISERFGEMSGTFMSVCMHIRDWGESETSASLLARYDDEIGVIARYAPTQPCLSAYIPVYMTGTLPDKMQRGDRQYDEGSLWWCVKRLGLLVTATEDEFLTEIREGIRALEDSFEKLAADAENEARRHFRRGDRREGLSVLSSLTDDCTERLCAYAKSEGERLWKIIKERGGLYGRNKEIVEKYFEYSCQTLS